LRFLEILSILNDLSKVNKALSNYDAELVHGIIGIDILKKAKRLTIKNQSPLFKVKLVCNIKVPLQ
jgi:hypothetical protein